MIKTISLGAVPCCDEFKSIVPHGLENFDDIIIVDFELTGVASSNFDNYMTFRKLKSNNFQILIDDKCVKLIVSHNDTFFKVVYVTITYTRISIPNAFYGMWPMPTKMALNSIYEKKGIKNLLTNSILEVRPMTINVNLGIKKVIFNKPATIVLWEDGSKTVVKLNKGERWDPEKGLAMAIIKKKFGLKEFFKYME